MCPKPRIPFFWFTSIGVQKQPILVEVLAPMRLGLRGSHVQRQYRKWTTLRSKSSTIKGLLYACWRSRCKAFVARKARTIALSKVQRSCHKTSDNQPIHKFGYPFGDSIPGLYCVAWLDWGHARKCQFKDFCEKERYESCSVQRMFTAETFVKRRKRENSPVVMLLPGSHECLASRNPHVLCQKHGGACVCVCVCLSSGYEGGTVKHVLTSTSSPPMTSLPYPGAHIRSGFMPHIVL